MVTIRQREAFWNKVEIRGDDDCWVWVGSRMGKGNPARAYGTFRVGRRTLLAHRVSWALWHGRQPPRNVLHECDNPSCVNPHHLRDGSQSENMVDCSRKGRRPHSKLTIEDVKRIRNLAAGGTPHTELAKRHRVSDASISLIVSGKNWKHVP